MEQTDKLVTERILSEALGISVKTLQNYRSAGKGLPYYKGPSGQIRYDIEECQRLHHSRTSSDGFTRVEPSRFHRVEVS